MSCGVGLRSLDLALLWLWHRPAAAAPILPLAWELPYAVGGAPKSEKKKQKQKQKTKNKRQKIYLIQASIKFMCMYVFNFHFESVFYGLF